MHRPSNDNGGTDINDDQLYHEFPAHYRPSRIDYDDKHRPPSNDNDGTDTVFNVKGAYNDYIYAAAKHLYSDYNGDFHYDDDNNDAAH